MPALRACGRQIASACANEWLTFSFAGLLVWALMNLEACGTGNVENKGCILPLDFPE